MRACVRACVRVCVCVCVCVCVYAGASLAILTSTLKSSRPEFADGLRILFLIFFF